MKYWAIFKTQLANRLAYPLDLLTRSISIVMFMWIFAQLWRTTYGAMGCTGDCTGTVLAGTGLTLHDMLWYLMLAETIMLSKPRLARTISDAVKDGSIAYILNKPYNFLLYQVSMALADGSIQMVFNVLAGGVVVWLSVGPPPDPVGYPMTLVAIALAWLIDFCINAMIGLAAFLTEDISAFEWIYQKAVMILGGLLFPLDLFPDWMQRLSQSLPFAFTIYGPARLFVDPSPEAFSRLLAGQVFWLAALGLVLALVFRKGTTWLTINGG